eukprot:1099217-Rhodomonas_salina.1
MMCCSWLNFGALLASNAAGYVRAPHTAMASLLLMTIVALIFLTFIGPAAGSSIILCTVDSALAHFGIFNSTVIVLQALGISNATADTYFIDSGCLLTIVCNSKYMRNLRGIAPIRVKGLTGYKTYDMTGDMHFPLISDDNSMVQTLEYQNVLYYPTGDINLIASDNINTTNWDVNLSANPHCARLYFYPPGSS